MSVVILFLAIWLFIGFCFSFSIGSMILRAGNKLKYGDYVMLFVITLLGPCNLLLGIML